MKKYEQDELIEFNYNGEIFYCRITDNNETMRKYRYPPLYAFGTVSR